MTLDKRKKSIKNTLAGNIIFVILFAAAIAFLLYKCRYGFGNCDEAFYLTIPYRLYQGDSLFADEWHLSQMSSVLLLPFVSLYMTVFKSTEGIIIAFRYLYIFLHAAVSFFVFSVLKKSNIYGAIISALVFFIYSPFCINALSYNSMGIDCLVISCLLIYSANEKSRLKPFISGIFFAFSVLCCPYLVILYIIYTGSVLIAFVIFRNKKASQYSFLDIKFWLEFTAGTALAAAVFAAFLLSRASVSEIIKSVPNMLNDPEHKKMSIVKKLTLYYKSIVCLTDFSSEVVCLIYFVLFAVVLVDRKKKKHRALYLILFSLTALAYFMIISTEEKYKDYINLTVLPLNFLALGCLPLFSEIPAVKKLFCAVWIPGFVYSFCIHLSSNQLYLAIASASVVALVGSLTIIFIAFKTAISEKELTVKIILSVTAAIVFGVQFFTLTEKRYTEVFWEDGLDVLAENIDVGVEKGVITTPYKKGEYEKLLNAKDYIDTEYPDAESVLFYSDYTWPYLIFDEYKNSSYSAWLSGVNDSSFDRLKSYYELNPKKLPDLIYIDKPNSEYAEKFISEYGYSKNVFETGAVILSREG